MYNWVTRRTIARTEGPTYPARAAQTVAAIVATWIPLTAVLACAATPARARLDVRGYDWAPSFAWVTTALPVVNAPTVAQTAPAFVGATQGFRTASAPRLDLFRAQFSPHEFGVPDDWSTWVPLQDDGVRTAARARLDVRGSAWSPDLGWLFTAQPAAVTQAQVWPALLDRGQSFRTGDRARLDVRGHEWAPESGWTRTVVDRPIATWAPIFAAQVSPRTRGRRLLEVRTLTDAPELAWLQGAIVLTVPLSESQWILTAGSHHRSLVSATHRRDLDGPTHPRTLTS